MFWRLVLRSLWGRRSRLALALLAVSVGVTVAVALGGLSLQVGDELARTLRAAGPNFVMRPEGAAWEAEDQLPYRPPAGATLPAEAPGLLKQTFWKNNVIALAPEATLAVTLQGAPARLVGTWFARELGLPGESWRTGLAELQPTWKVEGRWPDEMARDEIALGRELAGRAGVRAGDEVRVEHGAVERRLRVTGIVDCGGLEERWAWTTLEAAWELSGAPAGPERIWLSALTVPATDTPPPDPRHDPEGFERYMCTAYPEVVARDLAAAVPGSEVVPRADWAAAEGRVVGRINFLMALLALAAVTASVLGLGATTLAAVVERRAEIGLLRALGAEPQQVTALLAGETLAVSLAGGVLGWTLGSWAATHLGVPGPLAANPALLPLSLLLSATIAAAATWVPLRAARRVDPVEALRG